MSHWKRPAAWSTILLLSAIVFMAGCRDAFARKGGPLLISAEIMPQDTSAPPPDFVPVEKEPRIIKQVVPVYPQSAIRDHLEGRVFLKLWIGESGKPRRAVILKSDNRIFNRPSIDAAMKYRFTPAIMNHKPVAVWVVIPFTFRLKPDSVKTAGKNEGKPSAETESGNAQGRAAKPGKISEHPVELIAEYNTAMRYERLGQYREALKYYRSFLLDVEKGSIHPEEMVRHAKEMVEKYSKMLKDGE